MTNKEILQADLLDILFEHRNKSYGAYALRKNYNKHLGIALGISFSLILLVILLSFLKKNEATVIQINPGEELSVRVIETDPFPDKPETPVEKNIKQVQSTNVIQIVPDNEVPNVAEQDEIAIANIGTETITGDPLADPNKNLNLVSVDEQGNSSTAVTPVKEFHASEIPASFPGGENAWINFLRRYLQTPDELEPGQRIEVRVKFWIDVDGTVSRFEVIKSGGSLFDKEVLRVLRKMPKWNAAVQNHNKVAVSFTQPIIFMAAEN